jgi:hypothetical protein
MARLHSLFKDAPVLGSLINPRAQGGDLIEADFHELTPLLTAALAQTENQKAKFENDAVELAVIAQGLTKAVELLAGQFTLVITNVPYLGRIKQEDRLREYCDNTYPASNADLATCFVERCFEFITEKANIAVVSPQNWLFLTSYKLLRESLLANASILFIGRLGPGAFETPMWDFNTMLMIASNATPDHRTVYAGLEVRNNCTPTEKAEDLINRSITSIRQSTQKRNPDMRIGLAEPSEGDLFSKYALIPQGIKTGDDARFRFEFFELPQVIKQWRFYQSTPTGKSSYSGMSFILRFDNEGSELARLQGEAAWGKIGVAVSQMASMPQSYYIGSIHDSNINVVVPKNRGYLQAVVTFTQAPEFRTAVRALDQKLAVTNATFGKVVFDLAHWQKVASEKYPDGLPKPHSDDPTQWLFNGHPKDSEQPLHVAVARLLGYCWPRQTGSSFPDSPALGIDGLESFADEDGIVCLPPLNHEQPAAARLRQLLTAALGTFDERALIATAGVKGSKSKTLEDWLRDEFFEQHAKLFQDRPFIWHIWDGTSDGFHALVNYHRLDHATLQKLTYSYLGNWIQQQSDDAKADKPGAAKRLGAANALQTKLAAILEGEAPLDIFVRWKPLKDQAQGWHPDINDGIRQNIRPFLLAGDVGKRGAGLFHAIPLALKDKDRGTEPTRPKSDYPWFWCEEEPGTDPIGGKDFVGNRWNDVHLTLEIKREDRA